MVFLNISIIIILIFCILGKHKTNHTNKMFLYFELNKINWLAIETIIITIF